MHKYLNWFVAVSSFDWTRMNFCVSGEERNVWASTRECCRQAGKQNNCAMSVSTKVEWIHTHTHSTNNNRKNAMGVSKWRPFYFHISPKSYRARQYLITLRFWEREHFVCFLNLSIFILRLCCCFFCLVQNR